MQGVRNPGGPEFPGPPNILGKYIYKSHKKGTLKISSHYLGPLNRGGGMGKPSKPYGLPDFGKWAAIFKYVRYISVRPMAQKLCRLTKIIHFKPPLLPLLLNSSGQGSASKGTFHTAWGKIIMPGKLKGWNENELTMNSKCDKLKKL